MANSETLPEAYSRVMVMNNNIDTTSGHKFSLMTYNILNDRCIREKYTYCPEDKRYMPFRSRLITSEVKLYNPDLICMQEVHPDTFKNLLEPRLKEQGYTGSHFVRKSSPTYQGDAIFYRDELFTLDEVQQIRFHDLAKQEFDEIEGLDPLTRKALDQSMDRSDQVILSRFKHKASDKFVHLASVHLIWGMLERPDLQAMQACVAIRQLKRFMAPYDNPLYMMAGDFNTPPTFPLYQMMEETSAPNATSTDMLKKSSYKRSDGKVEYMVETANQTYNIDLKFVSSYKYIVGTEPEITNCDDGCCDEPWPLCLDYIWFSPESLEVAGVLKTPPVEDITKHGGLPSVLFGSDHIPILTEFLIK